MGRLLLFAVTDLNNEADNTDQENTKLEQFRVCNHSRSPPFVASEGQKEDMSLRKIASGGRPLAVYR